MAQVGCVVIGRNEGARLQKCLQSANEVVPRLVYVDSQSTDNSVEIAREASAHVIALDMSIPFSAARARNAGLECLKAAYPDVSLVQFVDGDCELDKDWLRSAMRVFQEQDRVAVVSGRRRERYPERSLYNLVCDLEWDTSIGVAKACGGDALMRISALDEVGGYDPSLVAGEEPEMCLRLRQAEWTILRIDAEMTMHDAAIHRFSAWWKRQKRYGYALALSAAKHGSGAERFRVKEVRRAIIWAITIPLATLSISFVTPWALLMVLIYPAQIIRLILTDKSGRPKAAGRASLSVISRFAETAGLFKYLRDRILDARPQIIEYKENLND
ncbi:MAG: glycosyltransferase [Pseudomonadota bacterium]